MVLVFRVIVVNEVEETPAPPAYYVGRVEGLTGWPLSDEPVHTYTLTYFSPTLLFVFLVYVSFWTPWTSWFGPMRRTYLYCDAPHNYYPKPIRSDCFRPAWWLIFLFCRCCGHASDATAAADTAVHAAATPYYTDLLPEERDKYIARPCLVFFLRRLVILHTAVLVPQFDNDARHKVNRRCNVRREDGPHARAYFMQISPPAPSGSNRKTRTSHAPCVAETARSVLRIYPQRNRSFLPTLVHAKHQIIVSACFAHRSADSAIELPPFLFVSLLGQNANHTIDLAGPTSLTGAQEFSARLALPV